MCSLEKRGKVYILTLVGDDDHRFNATTLDAFCNALKQVEQSPDAAALVTTNSGKYFSNGLDLRWIAESPGDRLDIIRDKFENMLAAFLRLGVPTVAAICGHAAASGFMLALAHDYRFMTQGRSVLYMSELDHGMHIPRSMMAVIRSKLQPAALRDVVLGARKLSAQMAMDRGILDGIFQDSAGTLQAAVKEAEKIAGRGWKRDVYCGLRLGAFPGVVETLDAPADPYTFPATSKLGVSFSLPRILEASFIPSVQNFQLVLRGRLLTWSTPPSGFAACASSLLLWILVSVHSGIC